MSRARRASESGARRRIASDSGKRATSDRELYGWLAGLRERRARGKRLTERELMCLQMVDNGYGCSACGGRARS